MKQAGHADQRTGLLYITFAIPLRLSALYRRALCPSVRPSEPIAFRTDALPSSAAAGRRAESASRLYNTHLTIIWPKPNKIQNDSRSYARDISIQHATPPPDLEIQIIIGVYYLLRPFWEESRPGDRCMTTHHPHRVTLAIGVPQPLATDSPVLSLTAATVANALCMS